jgi:putative ABC transport system ATP-binding protein
MTVQPVTTGDQVPVVVLDQVTKTYPGATTVHALQPTTLTINSGEFVAIEGPSGSGKSTLLNILGLLDTPTDGRYLLDGYDTARLSAKDLTALRAHRIGFVFQSFHLVSYRTIVENVELAALYRHTRPRQRRQAAIAVLHQVGLGHRLWAKPPTLSGGERQRVAIARALLGAPALMLCDEPTGNLDTRTTQQILDLLEQLHRDGLTVIVITHDPTVAARAQRRLFITDGILLETPTNAAALTP